MAVQRPLKLMQSIIAKNALSTQGAVRHGRSEAIETSTRRLEGQQLQHGAVRHGRSEAIETSRSSSASVSWARLSRRTSSSLARGLYVRRWGHGFGGAEYARGGRPL